MFVDILLIIFCQIMFSNSFQIIDALLEIVWKNLFCSNKFKLMSNFFGKTNLVMPGA